MFSLNIKSRVFLQRITALVGTALFLTAIFGGVLSAQSVTSGYGSDQVLQRGMIVGLSKKDANKVEALDVSRIKNILGIVVNQNDSPITISESNESIFVTTSGRYEVLVSDQQGAIGVNDYISPSSLAGIGMKAGPEQSDIVGRATSLFDGKTGAISTSTLTDNNNNKSRTVNIGRVEVELAVGRNPLAKNVTGAPAFLSRAGEALAGKSVSAVRLYLGAFLFGLGIITAGAVLYAGIRSSIIAIGRNPLGKRNILRSLLGVGITSVFIFIVSVIAVYLLLKV